MTVLGRKEAYAKLNLILRIEGRRKDGFHQLRMLNVPIDFSDTVEIREGSGGANALEIALSGFLKERLSPSEIAQLEDPALNSAIKALKAFRGRYPATPPLSVKIEKRVPPAAGLGGGSSDAAAVLRILGDRYLPTASVEREPALNQIAAAVGADVPFFLEPWAAEVKGIGEQVRRIASHPLKGREVLLVIPPFGCSTPAVYSAFKSLHPVLAEVHQPDSVVPPVTGWLTGEGLSSAFAGLLQNDLLPAASVVRPQLTELLEELRGIPDTAVNLTGSGSVCYLFSVSSVQLSAAQHRLANEVADAFRCSIQSCKIL